LCVAGLIGIFCAGYVGYFVVDAYCPKFYYEPVDSGKNMWLATHAACMASYFVGVILIWHAVRRILRNTA
jgi:hypothetical protein